MDQNSNGYGFEAATKILWWLLVKKIHCSFPYIETSYHESKMSQIDVPYHQFIFPHMELLNQFRQSNRRTFIIYVQFEFNVQNLWGKLPFKVITVEEGWSFGIGPVIIFWCQDISTYAISTYAISTYAISTVAISTAHNFNQLHFQPSAFWNLN